MCVCSIWTRCLDLFLFRFWIVTAWSRWRTEVAWWSDSHQRCCSLGLVLNFRSLCWSLADAVDVLYTLRLKSIQFSFSFLLPNTLQILCGFSAWTFVTLTFDPKSLTTAWDKRHFKQSCFSNAFILPDFTSKHYSTADVFVNYAEAANSREHTFVLFLLYLRDVK